MDLVSFIWSVVASGTANILYDTFSNDDAEKLENFYNSKKKEEFEEYIQILIEENESLKEKLSKKKTIFEDLKTKINDTDSVVEIDIDTNEKELALGNKADIEVSNGGSFKFKYKG